MVVKRQVRRITVARQERRVVADPRDDAVAVEESRTVSASNSDSNAA